VSFLCLDIIIESVFIFPKSELIYTIFSLFSMIAVAKEKGMPEGSYLVMKLELASLQSVRDFVANLKLFKSVRPLTHLICNAAVYRPTDPEPAWTDDGFEMSMGVNHLGHFLLVHLLMDDMTKAKGARICIVGSITGNSNTVGGGLVYPRADLGNLSGLQKGAKNPISMIDSKPFFGAKAYKDSKVCNMMTVSELHRLYHDDTGIVFSSMYPGCIAETALFREKRSWFRKVRNISLTTENTISSIYPMENHVLTVPSPLFYIY
jgi:protochlorophyllide reductase